MIDKLPFVFTKIEERHEEAKKELLNALESVTFMIAVENENLE